MGRRRRYRYVQAVDDDWIAPHHRSYMDACCDCGLVHRMDFRIRDGRVEFKAVRDKRATAAMRRAFKFEKD